MKKSLLIKCSIPPFEFAPFCLWYRISKTARFYIVVRGLAGIRGLWTRPMDPRAVCPSVATPLQPTKRTAASRIGSASVLEVECRGRLRRPKMTFSLSRATVLYTGSFSPIDRRPDGRQTNARSECLCKRQDGSGRWLHGPLMLQTKAVETARPGPARPAEGHDSWQLQTEFLN